MFVKVLDTKVVVWLDDGSIILYGILRDGTLKKNNVLNGHIQGIPQQCCMRKFKNWKLQVTVMLIAKEISCSQPHLTAKSTSGILKNPNLCGQILDQKPGTAGRSDISGIVFTLRAS